jgi:hypothetical protein
MDRSRKTTPWLYFNVRNLDFMLRQFGEIAFTPAVKAIILAMQARINELENMLAIANNSSNLL